MTAPNPVRMLPSHGIEDQTSEEWQAKKSCTSKKGCAPPDTAREHHMISVKTGSAKVPYVEQCTDCSFIDATSLEWWADNAIKMSLSARAQRMAVAAESEPFAIVQDSREELAIEEVLGQALGAASMCWVGGTGALEFDGKRAGEVYLVLYREVQRFQRLALEDAATRAIDLVEANHAYTSQERRLAALRKAIEETE